MEPEIAQGVGVGRIVHYVAYNGKCLAGIITDHESDAMATIADLVVFTSLPNAAGVKNGGIQTHFAVVYSESDHRPGTWHWPERV